MSSSYVLLICSPHMFSSHVSKLKLVPSLPAPAVCAISNTSQSHELTHTLTHTYSKLCTCPWPSTSSRRTAQYPGTEPLNQNQNQNQKQSSLCPSRTAPTNHRCLATHMLYCDGGSTSSSTNKQHEHFIMRCPNDRLCPLTSHLH